MFINYSNTFLAIIRNPVHFHMMCFLSADVFCLFWLVPQEGQTDIFSVQNTCTQCRLSECFDEQFAIILLLSDYSSQTHIQNAPVNWYKSGSSLTLAAVCGSVFIQVVKAHFCWVLKHRKTKTIVVCCMYYNGLKFLHAVTNKLFFMNLFL